MQWSTENRWDLCIWRILGENNSEKIIRISDFTNPIDLNNSEISFSSFY